MFFRQADVYNADDITANTDGDRKICFFSTFKGGLPFYCCLINKWYSVNFSSGLSMFPDIR